MISLIILIKDTIVLFLASCSKSCQGYKAIISSIGERSKMISGAQESTNLVQEIEICQRLK